jgi:hypothetical protein
MAFTQQTPIGTPDVNLITKTLAGLRPDSALQEYAALHKNNVYILSLAKAESDRRKEMRLAAQGNPGQQPTVADQSIAGMATPVMTGSGGTLQTGYGGPVTTGMASGGLPEDQGIAQLPTPNMQTLADGGIAGFDESTNAPITTQRLDNMGNTGGMFNYAQDGGGVMRMSGGGSVQRYQFGGVTYDPATGIPISDPADYGGTDDRTTLERLGIFNPENRRALEKAERDRAVREEEKKAAKAAKTSDTKATAAVDTTAADKSPPAAGGVRDLLPTGNFAPSKAPSIEDATALGDKFFNSKERIGDIKRQVTQEQLDATNAKENSIASLAAFNKKQGPAYAGYEESLKKEELQDATDKEKAGLMALFKGFLGIAAGESPNAATNIAKGSMVGLEDYNVAMKEFKKAAKERNKEMQYIAQARRSEERGDFDKVQMYEDRANTANQASARFGIAAINEITNAGGKASADIYNTVLTNISRENVAAIGERGANARALLPTGDARTAIMLGSGRTEAERLKSGMGVLQELTADKTGMAAFKILGEINAKHANDPMFKPLTLADLTAFQRDYQLNMQAGPKNVSNKPTGKAFD